MMKYSYLYTLIFVLIVFLSWIGWGRTSVCCICLWWKVWLVGEVVWLWRVVRGEIGSLVRFESWAWGFRFGYRISNECVNRGSEG